MGFEVYVTVEMSSSPKAALMDALQDHFEVATHEPGSKIVQITEHVATANAADAIEFVRSLVLDAVPAGSKITEITAAED